MKSRAYRLSLQMFLFAKHCILMLLLGMASRTSSACCACNSAKYEMHFEGVWSANTHWKDFPKEVSPLGFSFVFGISHAEDYQFWNYGKTASNALKQLAETGERDKLVSEFRDHSPSVSTVIVAQGLAVPYKDEYAKSTYANFHVTKEKPFASLVSKITPSPDWFVGISGVNLCLPDCSWIERKDIDLYPIDAGTDSGISYTSPNSPTKPREPISNITIRQPTNGPFYNAKGIPMHPVAKLHLIRRTVSGKPCKT